MTSNFGSGVWYKMFKIPISIQDRQPLSGNLAGIHIFDEKVIMTLKVSCSRDGLGLKEGLVGILRSYGGSGLLSRLVNQLIFIQFEPNNISTVIVLNGIGFCYMNRTSVSC